MASKQLKGRAQLHLLKKLKHEWHLYLSNYRMVCWTGRAHILYIVGVYIGTVTEPT